MVKNQQCDNQNRLFDCLICYSVDIFTNDVFTFYCILLFYCISCIDHFI
jgi:hypothetical protein